MTERNSRQELATARRTLLARCRRPSTIQARRAGVPICSWNCSAVHDKKLHTADVVSRQHLRSASQRKMIVPRYRMDSYGRRCFAVAGPSTWNSLPDGLRDSAMSLSIFRRHPKKTFCKIFTRLTQRVKDFNENALHKFTLYTHTHTHTLTYLPTNRHVTRQ